MKSLFSKTQWILATQWDNETIQYMLAKRSGQHGALSVVAARSLEHTGEVPFIAELLVSELQKHDARNPEVLVALQRSSVEVLTLELPPATDEELAKFVPLQAAQQLGDVDTAMLDFLPLAGSGDVLSVPTGPSSRNSHELTDQSQQQSRSVLAVQPHSKSIEQVRNVLAAANLNGLVRIGFRPLATLTLAQSMLARSSQHHQPNDGLAHAADAVQRTLFITLHEQQADLLLLENGQLLRNRSIRLPSRDNPAFVENLVSEIRRTEMVAPPVATSDANELDLDTGSSIAQILAAGGNDEQEIWNSLERQINVPVQLVAPLEYLPFQGQQPQDKLVARESGQFAPLVGLLLEHTTDTSTVNFLNPRRPVMPPTLLRRYGIYATGAVILLAAVGYVAHGQRTKINSEVADLSRQLDQAQKLADKIEKRQRIAMAVQQWQSDDVRWLDELRDLSIRFPVAADAYVQRMNVSPAQDAAKSVTLQVRVRDQSLVTMMESKLRDAQHRIVSKRVSEVAPDDDFGWQFDATILITPRPPSDYTMSLESALPVGGDTAPGNLLEKSDPEISSDSQLPAAL